MKVTATTENKEFHFYPTNQVIAVIDESADVASVKTELVQSGFAAGDIEVLAGAEGLRRLDATGARHGIAGRLRRLIQGYGDMENQIFTRQADALRAGHTLVGVRARGGKARRRAELILKHHHGHYINFFGIWTIIGMDA